MKRREALTAAAALLGVTIVGSQSFLAGCSSPEKKHDEFTDEDLKLLDEVGETIIPASPESPGARAAAIGAFIKTIVMDCYNEKEQKVFFEGLQKLQDHTQKMFSENFIDLGPTQRHDLLVTLDSEAKESDKKKKEEEPAHYFSMIKQLTVWGYFTSEPGATKALRYVPIPGRYEGCIDYKKGEGAWLY